MLRANEITRRVLGLREEHESGSLLEKINKEQLRHFQWFLEYLFKNGQATSEFSVISDKGANRDLEIAGVVLPSREWGGNEACLFARDITERKNMEQELVQADRLATVGRAAAGLAHEINNPIGASLAYIKTLVKRDLSRQEQHQCLEAVRRNLVRAGQITSNLLAVSKPRQPNMRVVVLNKVVKGALELISPQLEGMEVVFRELAEQPRIQGDPVLLGQVLVNLLLNAKNATTGLPERKVAIWYSTDSARDLVRIYIEDNGKGVSQELAGNLFEPFQTSGQHGGVGLGLYVAKQIVEAHDGDLSVEQAEGRGALFVLEFPLLQTAGVETA